MTALDDWIVLNLFQQVKEILSKYENRYLEGEARELLVHELKDIRRRFEEIQTERIDDLIRKHRDLDQLSDIEYRIQKEFSELLVRIDRLITG